ncbi:hypothetical protein G6F56_014164 [Rhizopus delemar]|nr:hypothetical protein G6F56_014164 [Rhizopus delemar]
MEAALKKAGSPVESLYVKNEGHGFYNLANQRTYYSRLLAFLSRSLGGATAGEAAPAGSGKAPQAARSERGHHEACNAARRPAVAVRCPPRARSRDRAG